MTEKEKKVFEKYLPKPALDYAVGLWLEHKFHFRITKPRQSKLGDYCYRPNVGHSITVNANLNNYAFLVTYLHEIAHLLVQKNYLRRKEPHGKEWKQAFRTLLDPVMSERVFPIEILNALQSYYKNPAASSNGHAGLANALRLYDNNTESTLTLADIPENGQFVLNNRVFIKGMLRRTRYLCKDLRSNKQYVILARAQVQKLN
jgi:SprT protein